MSLLDQGNELVTVYQEVVSTDRDGNTITKPGDVGVTRTVRLQPAAQSGTSARRSEQDNEGFETETVYNLRFRRGEDMVLGAQARIEWNGEYWAVIGEGFRYNGSPRTRHREYTIRRS